MKKAMATSAADVWRIMGELAEAQKRTEEAQKRTEEAHKRSEEAHKRTTEDLREDRKRMDQEWRRLLLQQKRTDLKIKSIHEGLERSHERLQKSINATNGNFDNKWGKFLENLVSVDLLELLKRLGISTNKFTQRVQIKEEGEVVAECDASAVNGSQAVGVEVKTSLEHEDVDKFVAMLDKYAEQMFGVEKEVYGAIAFMSANKDVQIYAAKQGLILIQAPSSDKQMSSLVNSPDFKPRVFSKPG